MGVQDRKIREKLKLKKTILDTAQKLFIQKGYGHTSIRNIAQQIEYSPATIYLYFQDKDEILFLLQERFYETFMEKINEFSFMKDHFSRLKKMSISYIEFAQKNPAQYDLLFYNNPFEKSSPEIIPPRDRILSMIRDHVSPTITHNQLTRMPVTEAVSMVWAFLHGLALLSMRSQLSEIQEDEMPDHINSLINRFYHGIKGGY
jgi:AcrR family transcriptional regulator